MKYCPVSVLFYENRCGRFPEIDLKIGLAKGVLSKEFLALIDSGVVISDIDSIQNVNDFLIYKYGFDDVAVMLREVASDRLSALALAWIDECNKSVGEILDCVEIIYADLGYPDCVAPFVRYMPAMHGGGSCKSKDEAEFEMVVKMRIFYTEHLVGY